VQKTCTLLLIIYTLFSLEGFCQKLHLHIDGQTPDETRIIDSLGYTKTHKDFTSIQSEVKTIQNTLYKLGYIENKIAELKKINDSTFHTSLFLKKKFNNIKIYYNENFIDNSVLKLISKNIFDSYFLLEFTNLESTLEIINAETSKKGYPFSKLYLSNIRIKDTNELEADLTIESTNQKRTIDAIIIKGYEKFPRSYLKHFLKIKKSQTFNLQTIQNKTEQLKSLNFANEIKSPEVLFSQDSTTLFLYLEKAKNNAFDGFLGFGTNEETSKLEFDGYLNLNLTNNLNFGETFRLLYKSDENEQKTFETNISLPYVFKSPIGLDVLLRIFKKDSSFTTVNQSAKLHYQIDAKHKVYGGILNTESNNLLSENTSSSIIDYKTNQFTLAYQFTSPQIYNVLFPLNTNIYLETAFGNRKTSNETVKQSQYSIDAFKIFNFNLKNSIYIRINGSNLVSDSYFENELLRFGGINSIRGFEENSIFASSFGLINSEYRFQLNRFIYMHSIIDAAYFENKFIEEQQKLFSYGFGFGILTKAGLFKFNYANGKTENVPFKLSNSKIHLSLMTKF
jgi:hypothetical protein